MKMLQLCLLLGILMGWGQAQLIPVALPSVSSTLGQTAWMDWQARRLIATGKGFVPSDISDAQALLRGRGAALADAQRIFAVALLELRQPSTQPCLSPETLNLRLEAYLGHIQVLEDSQSIQTLADGRRLLSLSVVGPLEGPAFKALLEGSRCSP